MCGAPGRRRAINALAGPGSQRAVVPTIAIGLKGRCPRCGEGPLFDGFLATAPNCRACGLDFGFADAADGPAVFIMFIVGFAVVGAVLVVEFTYAPPLWLHMALWLPLVIVLSLGLLRPAKGIFIALQYRTRAREGRLDDD
jgi:uncharacterized protein (DUF983 family)